MARHLSVGDSAPDFDATLTDGSTFSLSETLAAGTGVILYFYPKDSTPGCTVQACDFRDNWARLENAGWLVIGVSKDSAKSHERFTAKHELNFELIVDSDLNLHEDYGTWTEKKLYGRTFLGCIRSTFAISPDGTLSWVGYGVQAKGHVERLMNDLELE